MCAKYFGSLGTGGVGPVCGGVLRVKPAKHPHISPSPHEIPKNQYFKQLGGGDLKLPKDLRPAVLEAFWELPELGEDNPLCHGDAQRPENRL